MFPRVVFDFRSTPYFRIPRIPRDPRDPRDPRVPGFWSPKGTSGRYVSNPSFRKGTRVLMSLKHSVLFVKLE